LSWNVLVIEYWNLRFICNLVLVICIFRHKNPRHRHLALTWPRGPDFQWKINPSGTGSLHKVQFGDFILDALEHVYRKVEQSKTKTAKEQRAEPIPLHLNL